MRMHYCVSSYVLQITFGYYWDYWYYWGSDSGNLPRIRDQVEAIPNPKGPNKNFEWGVI